MNALAHSIELSVVIPAHCESRGIVYTLSQVAEHVSTVTLNYEIIVVDDGSNDTTFTEVVSVREKNPRVKIVRLSRRFGKESALLAGLSCATGEVVITIDADLQHPPALIPKMVERWKQGAKIVHGIKHRRETDTFSHRWSSLIFNKLFSWMAGFDILGSSDFKLLDGQIAKQLVKDFPEHARFHRGLSTWVGYQQDTLHFDVLPRTVGDSRWSWYALFKYGWNAISAYSSMPLKVVPVLGLIMLFVSILLSAEALISRVQGNSISGFATLEITVLFTGSVIMIGLGIIGQYLSRMYDELKRRPIYLIAESVGFDERKPLSDES